MIRKNMMRCKICDKLICYSCAKQHGFSCPDCKTDLFLEDYEHCMGLPKVVAMAFLCLIFILGLSAIQSEAYNVSSTNCSSYVIYDTGIVPGDCGSVPSNNTALTSRGWSNSYATTGYYWNLSGSKAYSDSWVITVGGGSTIENYVLVTPPITCTAYFKPRTNGYGAGKATVFGINSAGGFQCAGGVQWGTSQTKIMYTHGSYTASAYDIDWDNWHNMTFYYKDNSNCTIRYDDAQIYNGASGSSSGFRFQLFFNMGDGENPMFDNIRCWPGTPDQEPKEWVEPPLPPATVYPVYNLNNVSNSNNSIYVAWSYNNSANGGVMIMRDSVNIANVTYSSANYNLTGLINNTAYNITLFSYNSTAINYTVNSGNSQAYKTQQYLTIPPIILYNVNLSFPINYAFIRSNPLNYSFKFDFNTTGCYLFSDVGLGYSLRSSIISGENTTNYYNYTVSLPNIISAYNFEENAGSVIIDDKNLLNGTNINGAAYQSSKGSNGTGSYSINFNGVNQYINLLNASNFERSQSFSYSFWIKTTSTPAIQANILGRMDNTNYRGIEIFQVGQYINVAFLSSLSYYLHVRAGNKQINDGVWHNIIMTYDGTSLSSGIKIYIDNINQSLIVVKDNLAGTIITSEPFRIGVDNLAYWYTGNVDNFMIMNKTLNVSEIYQAYNFGDIYDTFTNSTSSINNLVINQTYNLSQNFSANSIVNVSAFIDCNQTNNSQIRSNYITFSYNNDFTALPISFVYPTNNSILNVSGIFVNFSIGEPEVCSINDSLWNLFYSNYSFYSFRETTAPEAYYSINISCLDYMNNSITGNINFLKNLSYGAPTPYVPPSGDYNSSLINGTRWFNMEGLNTNTTSGVLLMLIYIILMALFIVFAEAMRVPIIMIVVAIMMFVFAFLIFTALSAAFGLFIGILAVCYLLRAVFLV